MRNFTKSAALLSVGALLLGACASDADTTADVELSADVAEATETDVDVDADADADADAETDAETDAEVFVAFANLNDGDVVASPLEVTFDFAGVTPVAAGEVHEGEGHFHVIVDAPCVAEGEVIEADENHLHFGDGATSATLELEAGEHTLCLQFADGVHTATALTHEVTITVE